LQREEIYGVYHGEGKEISELAEACHVSRPTIYKIIHRGRERDFSIHPSTNKRFRCLRYGIKRLSKIEEAIEARLKRQARRYNKEYPGQMLHGDTKRLPLLEGETVFGRREYLCVLPSMISPGSCTRRSFRTRPGIPLWSFWNRSWKNARIR
jgi:hypothetical protein